MRGYRAAVLVLLMAVAPASLAAQTQVAISAFGGVYLPTADLFDGVVPILITPDSTIPAALKFKQKTGFTVGGRVAVWPSARFGVELEAAYVGSKVKGDFLVSFGNTLVPRTGEEDASLLLGSINLVYALIRPPLEPLSIYISGGVGLVSRGGDAFRNLEDTSDIAGVAGLGLKYGVGRGVWIRVDLKDYISSYEETALSAAAISGGEAKLQNDLLILASVELTLTPGN
jgi:hypothetical protein